MAFWKPVRQRLQKELLKRGHCVGCGRSLAEAERKPYPGKNKELVICVCHRVYVYDKLINDYRRAEVGEL